MEIVIYRLHLLHILCNEYKIKTKQCQENSAKYGKYL